MDLGITGKTAIVAAASKGLGKAAALGLAKEGANLAICARSEDTLLETAEELSSITSTPEQEYLSTTWHTIPADTTPCNKKKERAIINTII